MKVPSFEIAFRKIAEKLGIKLYEMQGASCCPDPVATMSMSYLAWLSLAARNLTIAEKEGLDILTICSGCYETLKTARKQLLEHEKFRTQVNEILKQVGTQFKGTSQVFHFVELLTAKEYLEKLKQNVVHPLKDFKIGVHYGCHLIRPSKFLEFDDPERPESMDEIVKAIGGTPVDWTKKMACCGYCAKLTPEVGIQLVNEKVKALQDQGGADAMTTACPACTEQYDQVQRAASKKFGTQLNMPVVYLTELVALALGVPVEQLELKRRVNKPQKFLEKFGLEKVN